MRAIAMAAAALTALAGCDQVNIGGKAQGDRTANAGQAGAPARGGGKPATPAGADVQAAADPGPGLGKQPAGAIQASAGTAPGGGTVVDRAYLLGRWTDTGDCGNAIAFNPDGGFVAPDGTMGQWTLTGDRLTMAHDRAVTLQLVPIDQGRMSVVNPDGSLGESSRC
jgi:hypothetical protein